MELLQKNKSGKTKNRELRSGQPQIGLISGSGLDDVKDVSIAYDS